jgi:hypothetical protein
MSAQLPAATVRFRMMRNLLGSRSPAAPPASGSLRFVVLVALTVALLTYGPRAGLLAGNDAISQ